MNVRVAKLEFRLDFLRVDFCVRLLSFFPPYNCNSDIIPVSSRIWCGDAQKSAEGQLIPSIEGVPD